jgi:hypothetical protein
VSKVGDIRRALVAAVLEITPHAKALSAGQKFDDPDDPYEHFVIRVMAGPAGEEAEDRLDEMLAPDGPQSIRAALEADRTLGGLVSDLRVVRHGGHRPYAVPGSEPALGSEWVVDVLS